MRTEDGGEVYETTTKRAWKSDNNKKSIGY
jgi:hypothetical protein